MSFAQNETDAERNLNEEAEFQINILEQKAREDYLTQFSQSDASFTSNSGENAAAEQHHGTDSKTAAAAAASISVNAKAILEKWMYDHRLYCYPTKFEKRALSFETGLSVQKISNWFINSRRRMLPKMLQSEGKSVEHFTISRKKKKNAANMGSTTFNDKNCLVLNEVISLADYANQEESKLMDQGSIFYVGDEFKEEGHQSSSCYESLVQEVIVPPYSESSQSSYSYESMADIIQQYDDDNDQKLELHPMVAEAYHDTESQPSQPSSLSSVSSYAARGILYDESTQSKCIYLVIDTPI